MSLGIGDHVEMIDHRLSTVWLQSFLRQERLPFGAWWRVSLAVALSLAIPLRVPLSVQVKLRFRTGPRAARSIPRTCLALRDAALKG